MSSLPVILQWRDFVSKMSNDVIMVADTDWMRKAKDEVPIVS